MPSGKAFPPEVRAKAIELYDAGMSTRAVARRLGMARGTVRYYLFCAGREFPPRRFKPLTDAIRSEIIRLRSLGYSYKHIMREVDRSEAQVNRTLSAAHMTSDRHRPLRIWSALKPEEAAKLDRDRGKVTRAAYIRRLIIGDAR
jgi:IS30 family transposase